MGRKKKGGASQAAVPDQPKGGPRSDSAHSVFSDENDTIHASIGMSPPLSAFEIMKRVDPSNPRRDFPQPPSVSTLQKSQSTTESRQRKRPWTLSSSHWTAIASLAFISMAFERLIHHKGKDLMGFDETSTTPIIQLGIYGITVLTPTPNLN